MSTNLIRAFLLVNMHAALLAEVVVIALRSDKTASASLLVFGTILLGVMLRQAGPIIFEPRRAAAARAPLPRFFWWCAGWATIGFLGEAGLTSWKVHQDGPVDPVTLGVGLLPLTLCILIVGCCLLLVHFAKLRGQER